MHNIHMLSRMGACAAFLLLVEFCAAQSEMVLFTHTGWGSEENSGWAPQPKMLDEDEMTRAFQHLQRHALTDAFTVSSPFSGNSSGDLAGDFELVESLVPGFYESTYPIGGGLRLFVEPSHRGQAIYHESLFRPDGASFAGFRSIETLRYSTEKGLTKTVHRVFPMESVHSMTHGLDQTPLTSAIGHCECVASGKPIRKKQVRFQDDVVVDVPFYHRPDAPDNMAALNMMRLLLSDVGSGKLTVLDYDPPGGIVPAAQERVHSPVTVDVYNDFGEILGSRDTMIVTPKIGDEFGKRLGTTQLHDKLHFHHMVKVYDDWGEIIGTETLKHPISAHNIRGFRFYETWHFLKRNPCPVKKVKYVVPLVGSWDEDGNFAVLNPLAFAIEMP